MSARDTIKEFVRISSTAGLAKDVVDLLEKKAALLAEQVLALENEKIALASENSDLRRKVVDLEQQLKNHQPVSHIFTKEEIAILEFMDGAGDTVYPQHIAVTFGITQTRAVWLLERLTERELIHGRAVAPCSYFITQKGRDVIHEPSA